MIAPPPSRGSIINRIVVKRKVVGGGICEALSCAGGYIELRGI